MKKELYNACSSAIIVVSGFLNGDVARNEAIRVISELSVQVDAAPIIQVISMDVSELLYSLKMLEFDGTNAEVHAALLEMAKTLDSETIE